MTRRDFDPALERLLEYTFDAEERGGYAGTWVHESERRVDLFWKGPVPASLAVLLEELKAACPVRVVPAVHDVVELHHARSRITAAPDFASSGIVTLALATDGSGLELGYEGEEPPAQLVERLDLGVPVRWERGSRPQW